jgi:hypothetical protein
MNWLVNNLGSVVFLILGFLLSLFASWFTVRYSRKAQKADERRERVYARLFDELPTIKKALEEYKAPYGEEYNKIASEHLLYLVPKNLRMRIRELYDQKLPSAINAIARVHGRYKRQVLQDINRLIPAGQPATAFNDSNASTLASDLADCLLIGQIPIEWREMVQRAFVDVKQRLGLTLQESSVLVYFRKLLLFRAKDLEMAELEALKEECLQLIEGIQSAISKDLESQS